MYRFTAEQVSLMDQARYVWRRRGLAKTMRMPFGEESITETVLLNLAAGYPGRLTIVPFNKRQEGKNGADWAWAFVSYDQSTSFAMLVQAKVLSDDDVQYTEIKRTIGNSTVRQIDLLIKTAENKHWPALYAFYNHLNDDSRIPNNCKSMSIHSPNFVPESWGISIADAYRVKAALNDQKFDTHRFHSVPLHCLLCSSGTATRSDSGSPEMAMRAIKRLRSLNGGIAYDESEHDYDKDLRIQQGIDPIFSAALNWSMRNVGSNDSSVEEIGERYPGIDGVVIFQDSPPAPDNNARS